MLCRLPSYRARLVYAEQLRYDESVLPPVFLRYMKDM